MRSTLAEVVLTVSHRVHYAAGQGSLGPRDEHDGTGTGRRDLVVDGQLIGSFGDEEHFFLIEMDVVGRIWPMART